MNRRRSLFALGAIAASRHVAAQSQPKVARIGYVSLRRGPNEFEQAFERGLRERGLVPGSNLVIDMRMSLPDGIAAGFAAAASQGAQGVVIVSDIFTINHRQPLCDAALAHRLPTIFANRTYIRAGGLMSYGPDLEGAFHRAAYYVDRILKGARPADLPIEQPTKVELVANLRIARALDVTIAPSVLGRADEVI